MIADRPVYRCARLTLEALSAHGIQSGRGDATHDVLLVRDGNGLPALPGSSVAGVLRAGYGRRYGQQEADRLFGRIGDDACISQVTVGWGCVHDSHDRPVEGLRPDFEQDPLLELLGRDKPIVRQRVRLNHRGASDDGGKFDTTWVPAGVRYTSLLSYWCDGSDASLARWRQLLKVIGSGDFHLGHGTRSGAGRFRVAALTTRSWDLRTSEGKRGFLDRSLSREAKGGEPVALGQDESVQVSLHLQAEGAWRIGGGEVSLQVRPESDKTPDLLPQHELAITWRDGKAVLDRQKHLLPGSAIKGALRHRTAFHYRCLKREYGHTMAIDAFEPESCPAVTALFGDSAGDEGTSGLLMFEDVLIDASRCHTLMHNRIDRFTGGVIDGALFSEEVLWKTPLEIRIRLVTNPRLDDVDADVRRALAMALEDLHRGWLPLGASGSRGLGVFVGTDEGPMWSDGGTWITGGKTQEAA